MTTPASPQDAFSALPQIAREVVGLLLLAGGVCGLAVDAVVVGWPMLVTLTGAVAVMAGWRMATGPDRE